ncbi:TIGR02117 family protein [Flavobacterium ardleyense]|uniref:TIGR02117 family protein n=1 Tax=Flavobacterium ardleyense TaxID=2038737 RepID=A0ABW5Z6K9_9FLAO
MKIFKKILKYTALFLLALLSYVIGVTLVSYISVNKTEVIADKDVSIYIITNGVHTDIVVPIKNELYDWSKSVKASDTKAQDSSANFVAMGWGDKGFYLETPTWADLKVSTALKATTGISTSAMHITFYNKMKESDTCKEIVISPTNYKRLIAYLNESFQTKAGDFLKIETDAVYGKNDVFYEAKGSYSLFYTCNSWANQALKFANQKAALWTITDTGIFRHYSK